jgi:hypothetical protein
MKPDKSQTMKQQIVRGVIGFGLIAAALYALTKDEYAAAFVCAALSFIPLRGCPSCWLLETCAVTQQKSKPEDYKPDEPQQG